MNTQAFQFEDGSVIGSHRAIRADMIRLVWPKFFCLLAFKWLCYYTYLTERMLSISYSCKQKYPMRIFACVLEIE
jgi:hypothetical protein